MRITLVGVKIPLLILSTLISTTTSTSTNTSTPSTPLKPEPPFQIKPPKFPKRDLIQQNLTNDDVGCNLENGSDNFFKFTIDNLLESKAIEAYTEWVYGHAIDDLQLQQYGEVGLFGIRVINDPRLRCGGSGGCLPRIECGEMRELVGSGMRDEARRRYFITLMIKYTFDYMQDIIDAAAMAKEEIKDRVVEMVKAFTETNDAKQIATCETASSISWALRQAAHSLSVFYNNTFASQIDAAKATGLVKSSDADQVKARVILEGLDIKERGQKYLQPEISLVEGEEANRAFRDAAVETDSASRMNKLVAKKEDGQIYRVYPTNGDWLKSPDGKMQKVSAFPGWANTSISAYRRLAYLQTFRNETWKYGWQRDKWLHVDAIDPHTGSDNTKLVEDGWAASYAAASCDSSKTFKPNTQERQEAVVDRISSVFEASIKDLRARMELLAQGTANRSALADSMQGGFFLGHLDVNTMQPLPSLTVLKETMKQKAYEAVISNLLIGERCYAKCVPTTDIAEIMLRGQDKDKKKEIPIIASRFVPEENKVCQWECISKNDKWSGQLQMFGIDKFTTYTLGLEALSIASYNAWKDDHRNPENIKANVITAPIDTQFRMPTCDSEFNVLNDFRESDIWDHNHLFPVCCGNWRCNETKAFMRSLRMNLSEDTLLRDYIGKSLVMAAHRTIIRPYTHWNALCELGIRYAPKGKKYEDKDGNDLHVIPEMDHACSTLAEETRNMTEDEANIHFCTDQGVARTVLNLEGKAWMGRITPPYRPPTHREMCDDKKRMPNPKCLKSDAQNYARRSDPKISEEEFRRERDDSC